MVSKRQKLARKQFKEDNPHLFPTPDPLKPSSAADGKKNKKKKNNNNKKRFKKSNGALEAKATRKSGGSKLRKHPLRVPGMRPGESCFICKSGDHIAKLCPEKAQWEKNKICLHCRQRGHSLKDCPGRSDTEKKKFCYNCGEVGHSLSKCPKPLEEGGTKFASCFVCKERGHLSSNCPKNKHGIYPKGGSCKICGGVTHLAKNCPYKGKKDLDSSMSQKNSAGKPDGSRQGWSAVRQSGDDLEDDFYAEESSKSSITDTVLHPNSESTAGAGKAEKNVPAKSKTKQGPKVVNFFG